jgi:hypothetical protein
MGVFDRMLRLVAAFFLIFMAAYYDMFGMWTYIIGGVLAVTGLLRWCPLYKIIGVQTCALHEQAHR